MSKKNAETMTAPVVKTARKLSKQQIAKLKRELPDYTPASREVRQAYAIAQRNGIVDGYTPGDGSAGIRGGHTGGYERETFKVIESARQGKYAAAGEEMGAPIPLTPLAGTEGRCPFGFGGSGGRIGLTLIAARGALTVAEISNEVGCPESRTRAHLGTLSRMGIVSHVAGQWALTTAAAGFVAPVKKGKRKGKK